MWAEEMRLKWDMQRYILKGKAWLTILLILWWTSEEHFSLQLIPKRRISISSEFMCCCRKHLLANHEDRLKYYKKNNKTGNGTWTWRDIIGTTADNIQYGNFQCFTVVRKFKSTSCQELFDNSDFWTGKQNAWWTAMWRTKELGFSCIVCFIYYLYFCSSSL